MANYKPNTPFDVPIFLFAATVTTVKGSTKNTYPQTGEKIYCSFKTFGGTEKFVNDSLAVENTAVIETWFRPDIKANSQFEDINGLRYEVLGTPENINQRNQFLKFKIRAIKGGG